MAHGDITHIDIPVSDLGAASAFYSKLFGWNIAEMPGFEGYSMWQAPNGISGSGLAPRDDGFTQPRSYVEVDSIDDTIAAAKEAGATVALGLSLAGSSQPVSASERTTGRAARRAVRIVRMIGSSLRGWFRGRTMRPERPLD